MGRQTFDPDAITDAPNNRLGVLLRRRIAVASREERAVLLVEASRLADEEPVLGPCFTSLGGGKTVRGIEPRKLL
jgi:hypothetical protein